MSIQTGRSCLGPTIRHENRPAVHILKLTVNMSRTSPTEEYIRTSDLLIEGIPRPTAMSLLESLMRATTRCVRQGSHESQIANDLVVHHSERQQHYSPTNLCTSIASGRQCVSFGIISSNDKRRGNEVTYKRRFHLVLAPKSLWDALRWTWYHVMSQSRGVPWRGHLTKLS